METLANQIKKDNAVYIADAQKLRSEFDYAIQNIRVYIIFIIITVYDMFMR